jgi:hypothetical protein
MPNLATLTTYHKNKWESAELMDIYHVVGVTAVLYPTFGTLINVVLKKVITYLCHSWRYTVLCML